MYYVYVNVNSEKAVIDGSTPKNGSSAAPESATRHEYSIRDLAREFDITTRTIRFYEAKGLLCPRRRGTTRVFTSRDRVHLILILRGKRLGFSLDEIGKILDMYGSAPGEAGQLEYMLEFVARQRALLKGRRRDIETSLAELNQLEQRCRRRLAALPQ